MHKSQTTRSVRLRKYQVVYEACMQRFTKPDKDNLEENNVVKTHKKCKHIEDDNKPIKPSKPIKPKLDKLIVHTKPPTKSPTKSPTKTTTKSTKSIKPKKPTVVKSRARLSEKSRTLNSYQMFVKQETSDPKYKDMSATDRLKAIGKAWSASIKNK